MATMVTIDGARGGGQMLRNAVALAAICRRPVRVVNIRGGRPQPGLRPQHLTGVRAVAEVCHAELQGAEIGSTEISLVPGSIAPRGDWRLDVGTAGSVTLILQSLLPALAHAAEASQVTLLGGTDVPFAPPVDYFTHVFAPTLRLLGVDVELRAARRGFYPKGGGEVTASVRPAARVRGITWTERAKVVRVRGRSYSQGLPEHIAERMREAAVRTLGHGSYGKADVELEVVAEGPSTGCGIGVWAETPEGIALGGNALGERGKPAERVGEEAAKMLLRELKGAGAVDSHLADQLLVWLAVADGPSEFTTSQVTEHMSCAAEVALAVAGAHFTFDPGPPVLVRCQPAPRQD